MAFPDNLVAMDFLDRVDQLDWTASLVPKEMEASQERMASQEKTERMEMTVCQDR